MVKETPDVSILLISEDSSSRAPFTMNALAKKVLLLVDPETQTQKIQFVPLAPDHPGTLASIGSNWRSKKNQSYCTSRNELVKSIATSVALANSFVFFHVDGDTTWNDRAHSAAIADFDKRIRGGLHAFLCSTRRTEAEVSVMEAKLFLVMPFYSIEAWLYQNTVHAIELCTRHHGGKDVEKFQQWAADRSALDEVLYPKQQVVLEGRYNDSLASNVFPAADVYGARKSFASVVDTLKGSTTFMSALARTHG